MNFKNEFEKKVNEKNAGQEGFIRETIPPPPASMAGPQKAALNRKGNLLLNSGEVETARRIFITTGYSDGLSRIGNYYKSQSRMIDALRMYWMAHDRAQADPVIERLAELVRIFLQEEREEREKANRANKEEHQNE